MTRDLDTERLMVAAALAEVGFPDAEVVIDVERGQVAVSRGIPPRSTDPDLETMWRALRLVNPDIDCLVCYSTTPWADRCQAPGTLDCAADRSDW